MGHLALIVKATRLCNLRCSYCHDWRAGKNQTMGFSVMAKTIASALSDPENDAVEFIWHGGEPTVLPFSFYEKDLRTVNISTTRPNGNESNTNQWHKDYQTMGTIFAR